MNAYELAKELKEDTCIQIGSLKPKELADVLIQMADRIAELEDRLSMYEIKDLDKPQIKELSDEEIDEVLYSMDWAHDPVKFARAILKKASEK